VVPSDLVKFGKDVAVALKDALGGDLVGVYFVGSVALGGYVPGESDGDVIGVARSQVADGLRLPIADAVARITPSCPARGLEFTLYRSEVVAGAPDGADFELNANGGPRMERTLHLDAGAEPGFWYVLDRAIAHRYGIAIVGPPAAGVFAAVARATLLDAHDPVDAMAPRTREGDPVLGAECLPGVAVRRRRRLGSKLDGATWARMRWTRPDLIDAAVELRHSRPATLDGADVKELLKHVEDALLTST
jgi:hypothetical protein